MSLSVESYSSKSLVVRGEYKVFSDIIRDTLNGRYNTRLRGGPGWLVNKERMREVEALVEKHNGTMDITSNHGDNDSVRDDSNSHRHERELHRPRDGDSYRPRDDDRDNRRPRDDEPRRTRDDDTRRNRTDDRDNRRPRDDETRRHRTDDRDNRRPRDEPSDDVPLVKHSHPVHYEPVRQESEEPEEPEEHTRDRPRRRSSRRRRSGVSPEILEELQTLNRKLLEVTLRVDNIERTVDREYSSGSDVSDDSDGDNRARR